MDDPNQSQEINKTVEKSKKQNIIIVNHQEADNLIQQKDNINLISKFNDIVQAPKPQQSASSQQPMAKQSTQQNSQSPTQVTQQNYQMPSQQEVLEAHFKQFQQQQEQQQMLEEQIQQQKFQQQFQFLQQAQMQMQNPLGNMTPQYDSQINYFTEFMRLYCRNQLMINQMKDYSEEIREMKMRVERLENKIESIDGQETSSLRDNQQKKSRRCASEIIKNFICPYVDCKKQYGSEVSLNLHIKLKHNGGNKTEREKLARTIFLAQVNGENVPDVSLNLPPGFMEQYKDSMKKLKPKMTPEEVKEFELQQDSNIDSSQQQEQSESNQIQQKQISKKEQTEQQTTLQTQFQQFQQHQQQKENPELTALAQSLKQIASSSLGNNNNNIEQSNQPKKNSNSQ